MPPNDPSAQAVTRPAIPERWVFFGVWCATAILGFLYFDRGWMAQDVGTLGHAAERVLAGELPHRDFVDVYTGGQAMFNAAAFAVFGVSLTTLRLVFLAAYLLWVPAVWVVARTFGRPPLAAAVTFLAASLTLPIYAEGMPSWYNLFLATAGVAFLLRYSQGRQVFWVVLAGVAGGLSILFKIVGLYYVAAALLFLLYLETTDESGQDDGPDLMYRGFAASACLVVALLVLSVVMTGSDTKGLVHFALPPLAAVAVVAGRFRTASGRKSSDRFRRALASILPFVAGVGGPIMVFLVPYVLSGALGSLYEGVLVLPRLRFEFAAWDSPRLLGFLPAIGVVAWVAWTPSWDSAAGRGIALAGGALMLGAVAMTHVDGVYRTVWWTLRSFGPVLAVAGAWILLRRGRDGPARQGAGKAGGLLVLAVFGFCNLVQIPFAAPVYFLYAAPLLVLLAIGLSGDRFGAANKRLMFATVVLVGFSIFRLDAGFLYHLGFRYRAHRQTEVLELPRARGIRVTPEEKDEIERLVNGVLRLGAGPTILAIPDAPEVYFLTGLKNPTRALFEFFDDGPSRTEQVLSLLDDTQLDLVVLNRRRLFSPPVEGPLLDSLLARFPLTAEVGRFRILWKGPEQEAGGG
jgi:hypothetical protein